MSTPHALLIPYGIRMDAWQTAMRGAGLSPHTIRQRTGYVSRFFVDTGLGPDDVDSIDVSAWLADHDWRPETRKAARGALGAYYKWAIQTGQLLGPSPVDATNPTRVPPAVPHPVPESILSAALERTSGSVHRMILLGAYAGLRRAEIATIRYDDAQAGVLHVTGKGGRERHVPMHPRILHAWPSEGVGELFPHYDPDRVGRVVSRALGGGWTCHSLRHRFATRLYANTRDVLVAQQVLGHSSPVTTQRYVQMSSDAAAKAIDSID